MLFSFLQCDPAYTGYGIHRGSVRPLSPDPQHQVRFQRPLAESGNKLNEQIRENEISSSYNEANSIDDLITDEDPKKDTDNYEVKKNDLINRFKEIGALENKTYNTNIKDGKKYLVFETLNLEMTDNQIKSTFKNIISDEFGIEITESKLAENKFFKIYLIEEN